MKKFIYALPVILLIVLIALFIIFSSKENNSSSQDTDTPSLSSSQTPVFTWRYEYDDTLNPDGGPQTNIFLDAKYADGSAKTKFIALFPGSCNDYANPDQNIYANSSMIMCYYAGFGQYYKVISSEGKYLVQRKEFDEGGPDYTPPVQEFETIAEF